MLRVAVFSLVAQLVVSQTTEISQCLNKPGERPLNVFIEGCLEPPCLLPQLQDAVLHITFRAPHTIRSMRTVATAHLTLGPIPINVQYPLGANAVTCNFLTNTYCPVLESEVVQYTLRMFIESTFPEGTSPTIEFQVVDNTGPTEIPVMCLRVPIRIGPPVEATRV